MNAVIGKLTIMQECHDRLMFVPIRDCRKLEVHDVVVPQPIFHHIIPHLFSCGDETSNMRNGNVVHTEDAGCISVDGETYDGFILRGVKSVGLNALAIV